ncbi:MAG: hypothetical protein EA361_03365 [Bacteroidetes bacterium]|nr:MAG: hypothetical protein EA361_03365 [Bacteroidota bacterium]
MEKHKNNHLTAEEIAVCAEAAMANRFNALADALKEHLQECDQCSAEVAMVADIADLEFEEEPASKGRFTLHYPVIPLLVAAAILGFIILVWVPGEKSSEEGNMVVAEQQLPQQEGAAELNGEVIGEEVTPEAVSEPVLKSDKGADVPYFADEPDDRQASETNKMLLAGFTPNPNLEMLVSNYQSAYRGVQVIVKTPSGISIADYATLDWENPRERNLLVEIFDNKENEVFSVFTSSSFVVIPDLPPGLYYWKLIDEEDYDLLFAGKIVQEY